MKTLALLLVTSALSAHAQLTKSGCANLESVFLAFGYETTATTKDMFRGCGCDFAVSIPRGSSAEAECADSSDGPNASVDSITISNPPLIRRTFPSALVKSKGNSAGFEYLRELTFTDEALKGAALSQAEMLPSLTRKIDISNNKDLEPWPGLTADGSKPFYSFEQVTQRNVPNACCPPGTPDAITCFPSSSICKAKPGSTSSSSSSSTGATSGSESAPPAPIPAPPSSGIGESGSGATMPNQQPPAEKPVTMAKPITPANVPPMVPTVEVPMKTMGSGGAMPSMGMPEGKPGMGSAEVTGKKGGEANSSEGQSIVANAEGKGTTAKGEAAKGEGKAEKKEEVQISTVAKIVGISILGVFVVGVVIAATRMAMAGGGHEKKHVVEDVEAK
ncbi:hypothetical protein BJ741DRAFT_590097 [Chytriomyces cf. hyalinus JEL632]|nr:hypothetical protein BJ741DRAFT_590097 [Chytriomyces cf. hyalinus JEL632]